MNRIFKVQLLASIVALGGPALLNAEIYRCIDTDTVIFSDLPCAENAERYEVQAALSIIETPPGMEAIAEQNQQLVEQRQQRREQNRAAAQARLREQEEAERRQFEYPPIVYQPVFFRANPPLNGGDERPAEPSDPSQEPVVSPRSRILSNRNTDTQRDILRPRRETP